MSRRETERVDHWLKELEALPRELAGTNAKGLPPDDQRQLIKMLHDLCVRAEGFTTAILGENCECTKQLRETGSDISSLLDNHSASSRNAQWGKLIGEMEAVLRRSKAIALETLEAKAKENSWSGFLKSPAAKGILLAAFTAVATGFLGKEVLVPLVQGVTWNKLGGAFPNFEVVEHERVVDLTEWTHTPVHDSTSQTGKAKFSSNLKVRKIRDEGTEFSMPGASSGSKPVFTSNTHTIEQRDIDMKLVGWANMPKQSLAVLHILPETKANAVFDANITSIRYQGFSDPQSEWTSVGIWQPTRRLVLKVLFPPGKVGRDFQFRTAFFYDNNNFKAVTPTKSEVLTSQSSIVWIVEHPVLGNAYRIDWNW